MCQALTGFATPMEGNVGYLAAVIGGLVSFLSPCVLPLVPAYLSIITGLDVTRLERTDRSAHLAVVRDTLLFIAGFSTVFILLGLTATSLGSALVDNQVLLTQLAGILIVAMSLFVLGSLFLKAPWLYQEARFHPDLSRFGPLAAPVAGVAFGLGWTPCIGPVLTSILALAATRGEAMDGAVLLALYSAGLGIPFLITGIAFSRVAGTFAFIKRHFTVVTALSAASLAFFGVLLTLNRMLWVTVQLQAALRATGLDVLVELG